MHPIWLIDDILFLVLEYLDRPDLAALAQVCRRICIFATDQLWKTIPSFTPFIYCLPNGTKSRSLKIQDLERLDMYGSKVRHICIEGEIRFPVQVPWPRKMNNQDPANGKSWEDLWSEIATVRSPSQFLPNLRSIRINHVEEDTLFPLIGISGSNLRKVSIKYLQYGQRPSIVWQMLAELQDYSRLEDVWVKDGGHHLLPTKLIKAAPLKRLAIPTRYFSHRKGPSTFGTCPLRTEILEKSDIKSLTLNLTRDWYSPKVNATDGKFFPKLKSLWLDITALRPESCGLAHATGTDSSWTCHYYSDYSRPEKEICGRQPPMVFFHNLDSPELSLLNIKFPYGTSSAQFVAVVKAAHKNCRLNNLTELALAGAGTHRSGAAIYWSEPQWKIPSPALREAIGTLLPLPQLTTLRLSVSPSFLGDFDLGTYQAITDGLPALERLWLCHPLGPEWRVTRTDFCQAHHGENVPLQNLAAFCSMLPNLVEVSIGVIDVSSLGGTPRLDWVSPGLNSLLACVWKGTDVIDDRLSTFLKTWFPNATFPSELTHELNDFNNTDDVSRPCQMCG